MYNFLHNMVMYNFLHYIFEYICTYYKYKELYYILGASRGPPQIGKSATDCKVLYTM